MTTKERLSFLINLGFTITSFARRVKCDKTTLGRWLRGETNLSARLERDVKKEINQLLQELDSIKEENYGMHISTN